MIHLRPVGNSFLVHFDGDDDLVPAQRPNRGSTEHLQDQGQLRLDGIQEDVRALILDALEQRMATFALPDDDLLHVLTASMGLDGPLATCTDTQLGLRKPAIVVNRDRFGTPEAVAFSRAQAAAQARAGYAHQFPGDPLRSTFDHEALHFVVDALVGQVRGADALLRARQATALGIDRHIPGSRNAKIARAIIEQISVYGAFGDPGAEATPEDAALHRAAELDTESLMVYVRLRDDPAGAPPLARAIGELADIALGTSSPGIDSRITRLRALSSLGRKFRALGMDGTAQETVVSTVEAGLGEDRMVHLHRLDPSIRGKRTAARFIDRPDGGFTLEQPDDGTQREVASLRDAAQRSLARRAFAATSMHRGARRRGPAPASVVDPCTSPQPTATKDIGTTAPLPGRAAKVQPPCGGDVPTVGR